MAPVDQIVCPACSDRRIVGVSEKVTMLRQAGKLRRASQPDPELVSALLDAVLPTLACRKCGHVGLQLRTLADDEDAEVWGEARRCAGCGKPIPAERLEVFPDARRCAVCEQAHQSGDADQVEYCPRCGSPMVLQSAGGVGLARYRSRCTGCGYRG